MLTEDEKRFYNRNLARIERKTGARGLRSIIEEIMRDIMFDIPSNPKIEKCIVTRETVVEGKEQNLL